VRTRREEIEALREAEQLASVQLKLSSGLIFLNEQQFSRGGPLNPHRLAFSSCQTCPIGPDLRGTGMPLKMRRLTSTTKFGAET
jgi:hypothetical protein